MATRGPPPPPPKPKYKTNHIDLNQNNNHLNANNNTLPPEDEQVVMTPRGKTANSTVLLIERKLVEEISDRIHVAGGDHKGIIINKDQVKGQKSLKIAPQLSLEFRVFLVSANTGQHSQESRSLRFWFRDWLLDTEQQAHVAQEFFRELVDPQEFPRDYVGFIKKIMKQMQRSYNEIQAIEIELKILEQTSAPPSRPSRPRRGHMIYELKDEPPASPVSSEDSSFEIVPLTPEKVLELVEAAYPNPVNPEDLAKDYGWSEEEVLQILIALKHRGLIKSMEFNSFTRIHHEDTEIQVVKQMPTIASNKQPTIAIVTAQYCEKIAVDAMLENKETFVRYTTVGGSPEINMNDGSTTTQTDKKNSKYRRFGESNVYTLGNIGAHRIVTTKLPTIGSTREATTASGNTTTRLLGTFQKVDYVFIVGVAGGIPHYTDYRKHVRLGDVVVSAATSTDRTSLTNGHGKEQKPYCYVFVNEESEVKKYFPLNDCLQNIAMDLFNLSHQQQPWEEYLNDGIADLRQKIENDFTRPAANTDKLYMNIGNRDVIEVAHPLPAEGENVSTRIHLGPIGAGRDLVKADQLRIEFAKQYGLLATDVEMDSVLDSIVGNCRESFIIVKGIADYKNGLSNKKWQNYASLAAASVVKSIICAMDAPTNV